VRPALKDIQADHVDYKLGWSVLYMLDWAVILGPETIRREE
jgi:hypothetical protein